MTAAQLVLRGLLHRWRTNLAVALGAAVGTAVLIGALGAGDSVRHSLRRLTLERLGRTVYALEGGERFLRAGLAGELQARLGGRAAALLRLDGTASARGGELAVPGIQLLGVGPDFWALAPEPGVEALGDGEVLLNEPLARRLGSAPGEEILLRFSSAPRMPGEAPLSALADRSATLRLTVKAVLPARRFGAFSLRVGQAPPLNAFVSRELLAARIGRPERANVLLLEPGLGRTLAQAQQALQDCWRLEDAGLSLQRAADPAAAGWELVSERVFLEEPVEKAALAAGGRGVLTYFVERIDGGSGRLHYAFVAAPGTPRVPEDLGDGELLLNAWAARELGARPGEEVRLEYLVLSPGGALERQSARFRLRGVVPIEPGDRALLPAFPGLAGAEDCRDWDPGTPIDVSLLTDRDQAYWEAHGGSPKAFVSLAAAQRLWANRFGRLTVVRFDAPAQGPEELAARLLGHLPPSSLGLGFLPVRESGLRASAHSVDFGQLFLGLSFFLLAAALLLTALLFLLSVRQRVGEVGLLAALGFPPGRIRRLLLAEGAVVAAAGSAAGVVLGLAYHRALLSGLRTAWQDAVRTPALLPYLSAGSVLAGFAGGLAAALVVLALAAGRQLRTAPSWNLRGLPAPDRARRGGGRRGGRASAGPAAAAGACLLGAGAALTALPVPLSFFLAGALLLAGLLAAAAALLARLGRPRPAGRPTVPGLGLQNAARRRGRSLAVASLAACGLFIVAAVAANRLGVPDPERRDSGTGGFSLVVQTALPLPPEQDRRLAAAGPYVPFRVLEGDEASCLNLNRVARPQVLGVEPARLRGRFRFAAFADGPRPPDPWSLLAQDLGPEEIPAAADQGVITWSLGLELGDALEYRDERGRALRLRLVASLSGSLFQGSLLVDERALLRHFPSSTGRRLFLLEAPAARREEAGAELGRTLSLYGASVTPAAERLAEFNSVQNTYLAIFSLLGWLGLLLGTAGLALVVARNTAESRRELALLRAVGLGRPALLRLLLAEHLLPVGLGLGAGLLASALAVVPAVRGALLPLAGLLLPVGAILASAAAFTAAAAGLALRAEPLPALRNE